ncbi:energy-coupling factor transporter transmembrane component T family protein [Antribacter gilvus]|uniref:energy-coupling factor transporter transmembrane component T family protein n=1 Tax=Antribacter gilvus TaxID=2304675 RepID=UPI000F7B56A1|nr:energy-coupling factor transporter transmembrane component T [Antribacter gilvus]
MSLLLDPWAQHHRSRPLHRVNPLALMAAVLPALVALVLVRDLATPLVFLLLATGLVAVCAHVARPHRVLVFVLPTAFVLLASLTLGLWSAPAEAATTPVLVRLGPWQYHLGTWLVGLATSLRLGALFAVALVPGVSATGPDVVRAAVQHLRVPYRVGYTAFAAFRFVPRFGHELATIRAAHRVRGMAGGRGPLAGVRRWAGYVVPLLAGALRHAERVALAMDARAFGAHPTRTERHTVPLRPSDAGFVAAAWAVTAAVLLWAPDLLGGLMPAVPGA